MVKIRRVEFKEHRFTLRSGVFMEKEMLEMMDDR